MHTCLVAESYHEESVLYQLQKVGAVDDVIPILIMFYV